MFHLTSYMCLEIDYDDNLMLSDDWRWQTVIACQDLLSKFIAWREEFVAKFGTFWHKKKKGRGRHPFLLANSNRRRKRDQKISRKRSLLLFSCFLQTPKLNWETESESESDYEQRPKNNFGTKLITFYSSFIDMSCLDFGKSLLVFVTGDFRCLKDVHKYTHVYKFWRMKSFMYHQKRSLVVAWPQTMQAWRITVWLNEDQTRPS